MLRATEQLRSLGLEQAPDRLADQLVTDEELAQVLASAPSDFTQRNLQLMVQAYRRREISEMLRCSVKTIESRPARHWSRVRAC